MRNRELINKFLAYLKVDGRSVLTLSAYATDLKQWERILGEKRIIDLSKDDAARLPRAAFGGPRNDMKPNSLARKITSVREFLRWGYRKGYLKNDLAKEIIIPRRKINKNLEPLSSNKLTKLRRAADVKERLILELILGTGMKLAKIVKIRMKDVKLGHCEEVPSEVEGRRGNLATDSHATLWLGMTNGRKIPISNQLRQALEYYLAAYSRGPRSTLIFSQRTGREITERTTANILQKLVKKAGLSGITARELRSTFIFDQLKAGVPASIVAKIVGHESLATIQKYLR